MERNYKHTENGLEFREVPLQNDLPNPSGIYFREMLQEANARLFLQEESIKELVYINVIFLSKTVKIQFLNHSRG